MDFAIRKDDCRYFKDFDQKSVPEKRDLLIRFAEKGASNLLSMALQKCWCSINETVNGKTLLHWAVQSQSPKAIYTIMALTEMGADGDFECEGETPLSSAIKSGDANRWLAILAAGAKAIGTRKHPKLSLLARECGQVHLSKLIQRLELDCKLTSMTCSQNSPSDE